MRRVLRQRMQLGPFLRIGSPALDGKQMPQWIAATLDHVLPCDLPQAPRPAQTRMVVHGVTQTATAAVVSLPFLACLADIARPRSAFAAQRKDVCSANDSTRLTCVALHSA